MTRHLPHVGLNVPEAGQSLYGDESTIGARGQAERDATLNWFASALGLAGAAAGEPVIAWYDDEELTPAKPYRTTAVVGEPIREIEAP